MNQTNTNTILSPLTEAFESLGFEISGNNGERKFETFSSVEQELNSLNNGVGLRDISHIGVLELRGKDTLDFLHRITTNSLKDLKKEEIKKTIFTSDKGKVIDLSTILNFGDYQLLFCSCENKRKVYSWIDKYIIADDVKQLDVSGKYVVAEVLGPQADSFMTLICGNIVNEIPVNNFKVIDTDGMLFFLVKILDKNDKLKYWIIADHDNGKNIVKYMQRNNEIFDFNLIGEKAYKIYRINEGIPEAPYELNDNYNPHELKLTDLIDFKKGCYIGQEVIARLDTYDKVKQSLKGLVFSEEIELNENYNLFDDDNKEAGIVTTKSYNEKTQNFIGLGFVKRSFEEQGSILTAKNEIDKTVKVEVKNLPFRK